MVKNVKNSSENGEVTPYKMKKFRKKHKKFKRVSQTKEQNNVPVSSPSQSIASHKRKSKGLPGKDEAIFKPVSAVKKPEDYSINWKRLKDIITKNDKKRPKKTTDVSEQSRPNNNNVPVTKVVKQPQGSSAKKEEVWFDDVDPLLVQESQAPLDNESQFNSTKSGTLENNNAFSGPTRIVALDCEMVGGGYKARENILARVSMVNQYGKAIYDKFVKPTDRVVSHRTRVSGVRPSDLVDAESFATVQKEVFDLIKGRILVGHALSNDMKCLLLSHPRSMIRDTSRYKPFVTLFRGRTPGLKKLSQRVLGVKIQCGEHNSVQDAQAAMRLYTLNRKAWEKRASKRKGPQQAQKKDETQLLNKEDGVIK